MRPLPGCHLRSKTAPSLKATARQKKKLRSPYPCADIGHHPEPLHLSYGADPLHLLSWPTDVQGYSLINRG